MNNGLILAIIKIMRKLKNNNKKIFVDYLIIGTGSIALRHLENIVKLSPKKKIAICRRFTQNDDNKFINAKIDIIQNLDLVAPVNNKSIAIICSAATMHIADAENVAKKGFNLLIEKPLTVPGVKTEKLSKICKELKLKTLVGYNMRFTNRLKSILNILKKSQYRNIKEVEISVETDFRKWRRNLNYKNSVSFKKELGGGVINELSHEIDYLRLLFGKPKKVTVKDISKTNSLFDIETNIIAIFEYSEKYPIIRMRLNMLSKNTKRYCKVYLDNSTLTIDHMNNSLLINKSTSTQSKYYKDNLNDSYMRELKNLSDAIKSNSNTDLEFEECLTTQYMINAMHKSLQSKKSIAIR